MISDKLGQELHEKSTRKKPLTDIEHAQLESWYEHHDNLESEILGVTIDKVVDDRSITKLQEQIEATLTQMRVVTKRIQRLTTENERL